MTSISFHITIAVESRHIFDWATICISQQLLKTTLICICVNPLASEIELYIENKCYASVKLHFQTELD